MKKFEAGKEYTCRLIGDHNAIIKATVESRTAKSVIAKVDNDPPKRFMILLTMDGGEAIYPDGRYSMCPIIRA